MWTPIPDETYYTVTVTSMMVGGQRLDLDCGAYNAPAKSIVDSGTTVLNLPSVVFDATIALLAGPIMNVTGASADDVNAFLQGTSSLDIPHWRFVVTCKNSPDDIGLHCYENVPCDLCLNLTAYEIPLLYNLLFHSIDLLLYRV